MQHWCTRFESKQASVKEFCQFNHNFRNICKSMRISSKCSCDWMTITICRRKTKSAEYPSPPPAPPLSVSQSVERYHHLSEAPTWTTLVTEKRRSGITEHSLPMHRPARGSTCLESFHNHLDKFIPGNCLQIDIVLLCSVK